MDQVRHKRSCLKSEQTGPRRAEPLRAPVGGAVRSGENRLIQKDAEPVDQRDAPPDGWCRRTGNPTCRKAGEEAREQPDEAQDEDRNLRFIQFGWEKRIGLRIEAGLEGTVLQGARPIMSVPTVFGFRTFRGHRVRCCAPLRRHGAGRRNQQRKQTHQQHERRRLQVRTVSSQAKRSQHRNFLGMKDGLI